jgi:hypothetical protein
MEDFVGQRVPAYAATTFSNSKCSGHRPNHKYCSEILKHSKMNQATHTKRSKAKKVVKLTEAATVASLAVKRSIVSVSNRVSNAQSTASVMGVTTVKEGRRKNPSVIL